MPFASQSRRDRAKLEELERQNQELRRRIDPFIRTRFGGRRRRVNRFRTTK